MAVAFALVFFLCATDTKLYSRLEPPPTSSLLLTETRVCFQTRSRTPRAVSIRAPSGTAARGQGGVERPVKSAEAGFPQVGLDEERACGKEEAFQGGWK